MVKKIAITTDLFLFYPKANLQRTLLTSNYIFSFIKILPFLHPQLSWSTSKVCIRTVAIPYLINNLNKVVKHSNIHRFADYTYSSKSLKTINKTALYFAFFDLHIRYGSQIWGQIKSLVFKNLEINQYKTFAYNKL